MSVNQVVIYAAGGFGRELAWLVESCTLETDRYEVACFVDDDPRKQGLSLNGIPVLALRESRNRFPEARMVAAIGSPQGREKTVALATEAGFAWTTLVHPRVERSRSIEIGEGTVVCAGTVMTVNIALGRHVQININCTLGHDVIMGDYATLAPGVHLSGWVHLGRRVYVGTGAVLLPGTQDAPMVVGDDAVIGAGAVVTKPVPSGVTVVGIPAKPIERSPRA